MTSLGSLAQVLQKNSKAVYIYLKGNSGIFTPEASELEQRSTSTR